MQCIPLAYQMLLPWNRLQSYAGAMSTFPSLGLPTQSELS